MIYCTIAILNDFIIKTQYKHTTYAVTPCVASTSYACG